MGEASRHNSKELEELFERGWRQAQLEEKNERVDEDYDQGGDRKISPRERVADWDHGRSTLYLIAHSALSLIPRVSVFERPG
jgi:hypothetical protein